MFSIPALAVGTLIGLVSGIYGKYQADQQEGQMRKAQQEAQKRQEELLKAKGPEATPSNETYKDIANNRMSMFRKGLMSTVKTSNFGLLDTATAGKTKLGQ